MPCADYLAKDLELPVSTRLPNVGRMARGVVDRFRGFSAGDTEHEPHERVDKFVSSRDTEEKQRPLKFKGVAGGSCLDGSVDDLQVGDPMSA